LFLDWPDECLIEKAAESPTSWGDPPQSRPATADRAAVAQTQSAKCGFRVVKRPTAKVRATAPVIGDTGMWAVTRWPIVGVSRASRN
jgi:hypothetical protein